LPLSASIHRPLMSSFSRRKASGRVRSSMAGFLSQ
jgi:hypothetical protein